MIGGVIINLLEEVKIAWALVQLFNINLMISFVATKSISSVKKQATFKICVIMYHTSHFIHSCAFEYYYCNR